MRSFWSLKNIHFPEHKYGNDRSNNNQQSIDISCAEVFHSSAWIKERSIAAQHPINIIAQVCSSKMIDTFVIRQNNAKLIQKILIDQKIFRNKPNAHSCITQSHFPKRFPAHIRLPDIFHHIKQQCTDEDRDICLIHTNRTSHQNRAE